ncbi:MAG: glycosyltransferase family 2 protein [Cryomorphaceae bacterium]
MLDLTIVIPVKNEARNLPGCLDAIGSDFAKSIVVVDSGSTDETPEIAKKFGALLLNFEWNGKFPKKRNWYLRNHKPETAWVLFLDADEYLTDSFKSELSSALADNEKVGYWLNYSIYFLGKRLRGGYPLTKLALFRPEAGEYERIEEDNWSHMDMEIHEHPVLNGQTGVIKPKIDHRDFRGVGSYMEKHNAYASWEAARFASMKNDHQIKENFTWKQKMKYKLMRSAFIGPVFFFGSFIFMGGFLDGRRGFVFAILKMAYFTQIYCRLREIENQAKISDK